MFKNNLSIIKRHFHKIFSSYTIFYLLFSCALYKTSEKEAIRGKVKELDKPIISYDLNGNKEGGDKALKTDDIYVHNGILYFSVNGIKVENLENSKNIDSNLILLTTGDTVYDTLPQDFIVKQNLYVPNNQFNPLKFNTLDGPSDGAIPGRLERDEKDLTKPGILKCSYDALIDHLNWKNSEKGNEKKLYLSLVYNSKKQTNIVGGNEYQNPAASNNVLMKPITKIPKIIKEAQEKLTINNNGSDKSIYIGDITKATSNISQESTSNINYVDIKLDIEFCEDFIKQYNNKKTGNLYITGYRKAKDQEGKEIDTKQLLIEKIKKRYRDKIKKSKIEEVQNSILNGGSKLNTENKNDLKNYKVFYDQNLIVIPIKPNQLSKKTTLEFRVPMAEFPQTLSGKYQLNLGVFDNLKIKIDSKDIYVPVMNFSGYKELHIKNRFVYLKIERVSETQKNNDYKYEEEKDLAAEFNGIFIYDKLKNAGASTPKTVLGATAFRLNLQKEINIKHEGIGDAEPVFPFWIIIREDAIDDTQFNKYDSIQKITRIMAEKIQKESDDPNYVLSDKVEDLNYSGESITHARIKNKHMILSGGKISFGKAKEFFNQKEFQFSFDQMDNKGFEEEGTSKYEIMHYLGGEPENTDPNKSRNYYVIPAILIPDMSNEKNDKIYNFDSSKTFFLDEETTRKFDTLKLNNSDSSNLIDPNLKKEIQEKIYFLAKNAFQGIVGTSEKYKDLKPLINQYSCKPPQEKGIENIDKRQIQVEIYDKTTNTIFDLASKNQRGFRYYYGLNVAELPVDLVLEYINLMTTQQKDCINEKNGLFSVDVDNDNLKVYNDYHGDIDVLKLSSKIHINNAVRGIILMSDKSEEQNFFKANMTYDVNARKEDGNIDSIKTDPTNLFLDDKSEEPQWIEKGVGEDNAYLAESKNRPFKYDPYLFKVAFSARNNISSEEPNSSLVNGSISGGRTKAELKFGSAIGFSRAFPELRKSKDRTALRFSLPIKGDNQEVEYFPDNNIKLIKAELISTKKDAEFKSSEYLIKYKGGEETDPLINLFAYWPGNLYYLINGNFPDIDQIDEEGDIFTLKYKAQNIGIAKKDYKSYSTKTINVKKTITPNMILYLPRFAIIFPEISKSISESEMIDKLNEIASSNSNDNFIKQHETKITKLIERFEDRIYFGNSRSEELKPNTKPVVFRNRGNMIYDGSLGYSAYDSSSKKFEHYKNIPPTLDGELQNRRFEENGELIYPNVCLIQKEVYEELKRIEKEAPTKFDNEYKAYRGIAKGKLIVCFENENTNLPPQFKNWGLLKDWVLISLSKNVEKV
ncbi:MAG: hypothetical protein GY830_03415 [Bacteroidetes bacterium]|nr:hypothetical protein [Bacteroidota bacterium]